VWDLRDGDKKRVEPGEYRITLEAAGRSLSRTAQVLEPRAIVP
jgi:hypothetical protein